MLCYYETCHHDIVNSRCIYRYYQSPDQQRSSIWSSSGGKSAFVNQTILSSRSQPISYHFTHSRTLKSPSIFRPHPCLVSDHPTPAKTDPPIPLQESSSLPPPQPLKPRQHTFQSLPIPIYMYLPFTTPTPPPTRLTLIPTLRTTRLTATIVIRTTPTTPLQRHPHPLPEQTMPTSIMFAIPAFERIFDWDVADVLDGSKKNVSAWLGQLD